MPRLGEELPTSFDAVAVRLLAVLGRIIVAGMGKSGHMANKIAAPVTLIAEAAEAAGIAWIFKARCDQAHRPRPMGKCRVGMEEGQRVLSTIRKEFGVPVLTDMHGPERCATMASAVEVLQIPAFLSRQTGLLLAAAETGASINVKTGPVLAPWDMQNVADKIASTGHLRILLCERGASFGYDMLVSDMRSLPIMAQTGYPMVFDATLPGVGQRPKRRAEHGSGRKAVTAAEGTARHRRAEQGALTSGGMPAGTLWTGVFVKEKKLQDRASGLLLFPNTQSPRHAPGRVFKQTG